MEFSRRRDKAPPPSSPESMKRTRASRINVVRRARRVINKEHHRERRARIKSEIQNNIPLVITYAVLSVGIGALGVTAFKIATAPNNNETPAASNANSSACPPEATPVTPPADGTTSVISILRNPKGYVGIPVVIPDKTTDQMGLNYKRTEPYPMVPIAMSPQASTEFHRITEANPGCEKTIYYAGNLVRVNAMAYNFDVDSVSSNPPTNHRFRFPEK